MINEATRKYIEEHRTDDVRHLALKGCCDPEVDMAVAVRQISGWQTAREKLPKWAAQKEIVYPVHLSMEQCSSETSAAYKAEAMARFVERRGGELNSYADLTAGFGVDFALIAPLFREATYVERQDELCRIAQNNMPLLGAGHARIVNGDGVEMLGTMDAVDWLFLDPARRDQNGGKTVSLPDCEPDVTKLETLLLEKSHHTMLKLSPMLDIHLAMRQLASVEEVHVVAVNNECKELLLIIGKETGATEVHTVNVGNRETQRFSFTYEEEKEAECRLAVGVEKGNYLYEPNVALLKAGASRILCERYGVAKLHPNSNLYTSEQLVTDFPGRKFKVDFCCGFGKKEIREFVSPLKKANVTVRNFPASVGELRKKLKLAEGGEDYLFVTTIREGERVIIGTKRVIN